MSMRGKLRLRSVASALICTLVAGGLLVQVAGHVSANLSAAAESDHVTTVEFMDVPAIGAFDLRRSSATRRPAEPPSWREPRDNKAVGIASTQDWSCDTNWDCGAPWPAIPTPSVLSISTPVSSASEPAAASACIGARVVRASPPLVTSDDRQPRSGAGGWHRAGRVGRRGVGHARREHGFYAAGSRRGQRDAQHQP